MHMRIVATLLCLTPPALASGQEWIVSNPVCPDTDFQSIQLAIDAAADGDTIVVRPALNLDYGPIEIVQKSLTIIAGAGNSYFETSRVGNITVRDLLPSQSVTIIGVATRSAGTLLLENNQGPIWIEEGRLSSIDGPFLAPYFETARVEDCVSVTMMRFGWSAPLYSVSCPPLDPCISVDGKLGLNVINSEVHLFDCSIAGTRGGPGYDPFNLGTAAGLGGPAVRLENSTLNVYGTSLRGGHGGIGGQNLPAPFCADGGNGAPAVLLTDTLSQVRSQDSTILGGALGPWTLGTPLPNGCTHGVASPALDGPGAAMLTTLAGDYRSIEFSGARALVEGESGTLELDGEPNDLAFLGVAVEHASVFDPVLGGTVALQPIKIISLGSLGTFGSKNIPLLIGDLTSPGQTISVYAQAYFLDGLLDLFLTAPSATTILDVSHDVFDGCEDVIRVDDNAPNDPGPGDPLIGDPLEDGSVDHPFDTIQEAIDSVILTNSTVLIADGTYTPSSFAGLDLNGRLLMIESENGPQNCILDATGSTTGIVFDSPALTLQHGIRGVTIRGAADRGLWCDQTTITIDNCIFENNEALRGGGIRLNASSSVISNCIIRNNEARFVGGGIYAANSSPTIINCTIVDNLAPVGGGLQLPKEGSVIRNCTIANNSGGGISYAAGSLVSGDLVLANSIVWGNTGGDQVQFDFGTLDIQYGDVQGGLAGIVTTGLGTINAGPGLIDIDPLFVDDFNGDYHLDVGSPCIDAGDPAFVPGVGEVDIDGDPRVQGANVDLGSDEF